jgi:chromate transporter
VTSDVNPPRVALATIAREWTRLGCVGFGGPPAHIALLRRLCVDQHHYLDAAEFEDAIAATSLLPGPASTQLAIYCAWRLRGVRGALVGGLGFILPGLALIIALAALFLAHDPPHWVLGAAAGAGAMVPSVALRASTQLIPSSWRRTGGARDARVRWILYALLGALSAAVLGAYVVVVLLACGATELFVRSDPGARHSHAFVPALAAPVLGLGGFAALAWVALKVGALSYGGGFVIIPLMQHDVVTTYHWMSGGQFLNAVALGQVTPGPVVLTIAVVGYAVGGVGGALLATLVAFGPSFVMVVVAGPRFEQIRSSRRATSFLAGAGPCVLGAIAGSAVPLALSLTRGWQVGVLAGGLVWFFLLRRGVVLGLVLAGLVGVIAVAAGATA